MKFKSALAVSAFALMMASPALASDNMSREYRGPDRTQQITTETNSTARDMQRGLNQADRTMRSTADDVRAFIVGDKRGDKNEAVTIRGTSTAKSLLGQDIKNPQGRTIAKIEDIIVDRNGKATKIVVSDGGMLGIGAKLAAFDYDEIVRQNRDGSLVTNLTQKTIDRAPEFSYDRNNAAQARIIPAGSYSVSELLDADLRDSRGNKVADVENLVFNKGRADRLLVSFDKTMGMGGTLASLNFRNLNVISEDGGKDVKIRMTATQSEQFENLKRYARR